MERKTVWWIIIGIAAILLLLWAFGSMLDPAINKIVAGTPKLTCEIDSDCVLRDTSCNIGCPRVVSKDWNGPFCPFSDIGLFQSRIMCDMIRGTPRCVEKTCTYVPTASQP